jgi:polyisoprenoid-binding protein YceI
MNLTHFASAIVAAAVLAAPAAYSATSTKQATTQATKTVAVDTKESSIKWLGKKVTGQHNGSVSVAKGELKVQGDNVIGGTIVANMDSIVVEDIPAKDSSNAKLTGHLKSDDFFGVSKFKTATFTITEAKPVSDRADATHLFTGTLEIKGTKETVTVPAKITKTNGIATATTKLIVDRTKFGIRYGSKSFFNDIGDKAINDEFELDITMKAKI